MPWIRIDATLQTSPTSQPSPGLIYSGFQLPVITQSGVFSSSPTQTTYYYIASQVLQISEARPTDLSSDVSEATGHFVTVDPDGTQHSTPHVVEYTDNYWIDWHLFDDGDDDFAFDKKGQDFVEKISLSPDIYNALGGNDIVSLPNIADYALTSSIVWDPLQTFFAGSGNDSVFGGDGDDMVDGGIGDDFIDGRGGSDKLTGGEGSDLIWGDNANIDDPEIIISPGNDNIQAGGGDNEVIGQGGDDTITAGSGNDEIWGDNVRYDTKFHTGNFVSDVGDGADKIDAGNGENFIVGGGGNDAITAGSGADEIWGDGFIYQDEFGASSDNGASDDLTGDDTINAGGGANLVVGGGGDDKIAAGTGNDTILGDGIAYSQDQPVSDDSTGADTIDAGSGNNLVVGGNGNDAITAGTGNDTLIGDSLVLGDTLTLTIDSHKFSYDVAGTGSDQIQGGDGNDSIFGGGGDDGSDGNKFYSKALDGGVGNDTIDGGTGNDWMVDFSGSDSYKGGETFNPTVNLQGKEHDSILFAGAPTDYQILENTAHATTLADKHSKDVDTVDWSVEKIQFESFGNNIIHVDQLYTELARFSLAAYARESSAGQNLGRTYLQAEGWRPVHAQELGIAPQGFDSDENLQYKMLDGVFTELNASASVYAGVVVDAQGHSKNTIVLSFRGTDELTDSLDFLNFQDHYDKLKPLLDALKAYIDDPLNNVDQVWVTGHSLGGAMAQMFLQTVAGENKFIGATFGSPGAVPQTDDPRLLQFEHTQDLVSQVYELANDAKYKADVLAVPGADTLLVNAAHYNTSGEVVRLVWDGYDGNGINFGSEHAIANYITSLQNAYALRNSGHIDFLSTDPHAHTAGQTTTYALGGPDGLPDKILGDPDQYASTYEQIWQGGAEKIIGTTKADHIEGRWGDDTIYGDGGKDIITGGAGHDLFSGKAAELNGAFIWDFVAGDEILVEDKAFSIANLSLSTTASTLLIDSDGNGTTDLTINLGLSYTLSGFHVAQSPAGTVITYEGGSFFSAGVQSGGDGDDTFAGGGSADAFYLGAGNNNASGQKGDDVFLDGGGAGNDSIDGGEGTDTVDYITASAALVVDLGAGTASGPDSGSDALAGIENAVGGGGNDTLTGNDAANLLDGSLGADSLAGGKGNDTYLVDDLADKVLENPGDGLDTVKSSATFDLSTDATGVEILLLTGMESVDGTGNGLANTITGNDGDNVLDGKGGADTMAGGKGDDTYVIDSAKDVVKEAAGAGTDTMRSEISYTLAATLENLVLIGAALVATGNAANNELTGNGLGNALDGKAGADTMTGADGNDVYMVDNIGDQVIEIAGEGTDEVRSSLGLTLIANVENYTYTGTKAQTFTDTDLGDHRLTTAGGADKLTSGSGNDTLNGGAGADSLDGGAGDDTYVIDNAKDVISDSGGSDTVQSTLSVDLHLPAFATIENVQLLGAAAINAIGRDDANRLEGNGGANKLIGNGGDDTLIGNAGNETLDGGAGADSMQGGDGSDSYIIGASDIVSETNALAAGGIDLVQSSIDFTLGANLEKLTLLAGFGNLNGTGNGLANSLLGNEGDNQLDGKAGADTMAGGKGNDTYFVDNAKDVVTEAAAAGTDTVRSELSYTLGATLENLVLIGAALAATGNAGNNALTGNGLDNMLDGKASADTMIGGLGNDTYVIDNIGDQVTELAVQGTDEVRSSLGLTLIANVENYTYTGTKAQNFTDTELGDHRITAGSGADTLTAGVGNDTLNGGAGADALDGGAGNDTYVIDNAKDVISDSSGTDMVLSSVSLVLGATIENLTLTGAGAINGTGNDLANVIVGNTAANILAGGLGDDILDGGKGNDKLTGGDGDDTFVRHSLAEGKDTITDFQAGPGGDVLDIADLLIGYSAGHEAEFVQCATAGGNTTVRVDADGALNGSKFTDVCVLAGVTTDLATLVNDGNLALT